MKRIDEHHTVSPQSHASPQGASCPIDRQGPQAAAPVRPPFPDRHHHPSAHPLSGGVVGVGKRRSPAVLHGQPGALRSQRTPKSLSGGPILSAAWDEGCFSLRPYCLEIYRIIGAISHRKVQSRLGGLGNRERIFGPRSRGDRGASGRRPCSTSRSRAGFACLCETATTGIRLVGCSTYAPRSHPD